ncbi:MAG TPA: T9SS type A sorting domain-containing protein [Ferruginibacter sp.]|nr:T9SS type A sorting domain-containing protein [Ferruginibacter sp.]
MYFEFPAAGDVTIKLMDITGRILDEQVITNNTRAVFDVSGYTPGVYLYQVVTNGKTQSGKVLIEK